MDAVERFDQALIQVLWPAMLFSVVWMLCAKIPFGLLGMLDLVLITRLVDKRFDLCLPLP